MIEDGIRVKIWVGFLDGAKDMSWMSWKDYIVSG